MPTSLLQYLKISPSVRWAQLWPVAGSLHRRASRRGQWVVFITNVFQGWKRNRGPQNSGVLTQVKHFRPGGVVHLCAFQTRFIVSSCEAHSWSCPSRNSVGKKGRTEMKASVAGKFSFCLMPQELVLLVTNPTNIRDCSKRSLPC